MEFLKKRKNIQDYVDKINAKRYVRLQIMKKES
jgi:hypothetical protein